MFEKYFYIFYFLKNIVQSSVRFYSIKHFDMEKYEDQVHPNKNCPTASSSLSNGLTNETFFFIGESESLQRCIKSIKEKQLETVKEVFISIKGKQVKGSNQICSTCTIVWGLILIFPLFFMCCDWWNKIAEPLFEVSLECYQCIEKMASMPKMQCLRVQVIDNYLGNEKIEVLYSGIKKSSLQYFEFFNKATQVNLENNESTNFKQRMKLFKTLSLNTEIRWLSQTVIN